MKNSFVSINSFNNDAYERDVAVRMHALLDVMGQTPSGDFLLKDAKRCGVAVIVDSNRANYPEHNFMQFEPPGLTEHMPGFIRIDPVVLEQEIRKAEPDISRERLQQVMDDCLLSFAAHELRHSTQVVQGATDDDNEHFVLHYVCCEADAYSWQNMIEVELQSLGLRPNIKENLVVISAGQQQYYDEAIEALGTVGTSEEHDILFSSSANFFIQHDVYFNKYFENAIEIVLENDLPPQRIPEGSALVKFVTNIFSTSEHSPYMSGEKLEGLFFEAMEKLPFHIKKKLKQVQRSSDSETQQVLEF